MDKKTRANKGNVMRYEIGNVSFAVFLACSLVGILLASVSMGCAGTQESDETLETSSREVGTNPNSANEENTPKKEEKSDKTENEAPPAPAANETQITCGDPKPAAKYNECKVAKDEQSCVAAGGNWTRVGLSPVSMCLCSTGQEECPCETSADCLSTCIAPLDLKNWDCSPKRHCSAVDKTAGCWCRYHEDGSVRKMCVD